MAGRDGSAVGRASLSVLLVMFISRVNYESWEYVLLTTGDHASVVGVTIAFGAGDLFCSEHSSQRSRFKLGLTNTKLLLIARRKVCKPERVDLARARASGRRRARHGIHVRSCDSRSACVRGRRARVSKHEFGYRDEAVDGSGVETKIQTFVVCAQEYWLTKW